MTSHPARFRRPAAGFTLIELLVAISLMAVLAVLGWRGLDSVLASRERIVEASDGLRALSVGFTQMEEDLRRSWAVRLLNLGQPSIGFVLLETDGPPALQVTREQLAGSGVPQLQRVVYRLRDGNLERGFGPWGLPQAGEGSAQTEPPMVWQPLLAQVQNLHMRGWIGGQGWLPAGALVLRPGTPPPSAPITGVEVLVERTSGERVLRVFSVKD